MSLKLKKSLSLIASGAAVLALSGCSDPQDNPAQTAQEAMSRIMDGKTEEACELMASSEGAFVEGTEDHAGCILIMTRMKSLMEPYKEQDLVVSSSSIDEAEGAAEVTGDDVNDEFKEFFDDNHLDLIRIDDKWYIELR
ncbi:hypothetical protein [Glutamicibacter sp. TV12E]|uniref:hypothetical protein n=1 Tax=Glutamicibacter sp. TV12E TaxID=3446362 RepID=UPI004034A54B